MNYFTGVYSKNRLHDNYLKFAEMHLSKDF